MSEGQGAVWDASILSARERVLVKTTYASKQVLADPEREIQTQ